MDFVAIDFETANEERSSACALGLVEVRGGEIVDKKNWLVKPPQPYFNPFNVSIHGITPSDVESEPDFAQLWPTLSPYFQDRLLVAHHASFDIGVLRHVLAEYDLAHPDLSYFCSRILSRQLWKDRLSYSLDSLARSLGIEFVHHDAEEDARACAEIIIRAGQEVEAQSMSELTEKLDLVDGRLYQNGHVPCTSRFSGLCQLRPRGRDFDPDHPFYKKTIVFTGKLEHAKRRDAMQRVVDAGGYCANSVTGRVDFLVAGTEASTKQRGRLTSKIQKTQELIDIGFEIEVLREDDFVKMLGP